MVLALGLGDIDQRAGRQTARVGQYRAGDRDLIVPCQTLDHSRRSVFQRRNPLAQFGFDAGFDVSNQMTQDIVEDLDLFFAQPLAVIQKKIRDLSKGADAPRRRAASDGLLELGNDGNRLLRHAPMPLLARKCS